MPLGTVVGLGPGHNVLDGDPAQPKGYTAPDFTTHVYYRQTGGWIKVPLGTEVGLGPGDIVRWGPSSPSENGTQPPLFGPCLLWSNDMDASGYHLVRG